MKNFNEEFLRKFIQKIFKENYDNDYSDDLGSFNDEFDEMDFSDEAMRAAQEDIESSGDEFEELGTSEFEKDPDFKEKLTADLNRANLELPSDEQEIEDFANKIKNRKNHEKRFGVGSLNESLTGTHVDAEGAPIKLNSRIEHIETGSIGLVERFMIADADNLQVKVLWISRDANLPSVVSTKDIIVKEKGHTPKAEVDSEEEVVDESLIRSFANGKGENIKPSNFPDEFKREEMKENFNSNIVNETKNVDYTMGNEDDPNQLPNPEKEIYLSIDENDENVDYTMGNEDDPNQLPNPAEEIHLSINENEDEERYQRIIFLADHEADHALKILKHDGVDDALDYLMQWDNGDGGETSDTIGAGSTDKTYEKNGYIMTWNSPLGYIGLTYDTQAEKSLDEDSQMKRHLSNQRKKDAPLGKNSPHSEA